MRWLLFALAVTMASPANADKARAREAYHKATQNFDLGEFNEALELFKEAYRNYEEPSFLFNIAQCYRQMGNKEGALQFYRSYLNKRPDAPNHDEVLDIIDKLEKSLAEEREVLHQPPAGTLAPEKAPPKTAPAPKTVPPPAGAPAAGAGAPPSRSEPAQAAPVQAAVVSAPPPRQSAREPIYRKWWLWTAVGAVVVLGAGLGVGLGVGLSHPAAASARTDFGTVHPF
jgi:tetratricopeptide (TPR) repeat protein